jgi:hypothetical protein
MVVAHHPDDAAVRARMGRSVAWLIDRMLAPPGAGRRSSPAGSRLTS